MRPTPSSTRFPYTTLFRSAALVNVAQDGDVLRATRKWSTTSYRPSRSEEHTSELQSRGQLVCRLLVEKKNGGNAPSSCMELALRMLRPRAGGGPARRRPLA